jgi:general secretion pathway protein G
MSRRPRPYRYRTRARRTGFTLMEVLLVMAILVILGALAFFSFGDTLWNAKRSSAKIQIDNFKTPIQQYMLGESQYPQQLSQLWDGSSPSTRTYLEKPVPTDPWGNPWQYEAPDASMPNSRARISSSGPNGSSGDADDVTSDQ